jgi:hypothetical protein
MAPRTPMILRIGGGILDVDMTKAQVLSQSFPPSTAKPRPCTRTKCSQEVGSRADLLNSTQIRGFIRKIRCLTRS